ncbi:helix-turn-helix transcriptional regulator [Vreelandella venusta]|uniref:Helix-turn-helix transcriptional regulator n=2 Tax=Vreelandella venusta TaxID=44935 RepID=A0AAP9ZI82_9GAMM|nr:helix-turn-helix transcriptional regulator [Halomonas venusta]MDW0361363.1 helix-turn-helix transcriptional regulator [Halomonas venusta]QRL04620.1 helix-turn-helix transcriptional regulator [Halomonas venusta]UQI42071.1 helix-turn-helix transcriptional regulator [Halomonas venusta]GEK52484.1 helix-turn-helix transcriptional regulator [Halomonas venusta]
MVNDNVMHRNVAASSSELSKALANAISALRTTQFTSAFIKLLNRLVAFDCAVIIGYRPGKHPIYLFDSLHQQRELLFQRYLMDAYQDDPFLLLLAQHQQEGVFTPKDTRSFSDKNAYYQQDFYQQTGWRDELCITLRLSEARWIVVYLGKLEGHAVQQARFADVELNQIAGYLSVLSALCQQHWNTPFHLASATVNCDIAAMLRQSVGSFGKTLLTVREQQVAALLVQGMDSQEIAEYLAIGHGTVKNHRKRIYAQLGVVSLSELFSLFLNHVVAASARP